MKYHECPRAECGGMLEYTNYDDKDGNWVYHCTRCGHKFIIVEKFKDVTMEY